MLALPWGISKDVLPACQDQEKKLRRKGLAESRIIRSPDQPKTGSDKGEEAIYSKKSMQVGAGLMDLPKVWKTDDGTVLTLRRLGESDTQNLIAFVKGLSVSARYFRFGQGDYDPGLDDALRVCRLDQEQGLHLIVVTPKDAGETVVGSARYVIQPDRISCEFVIVVADKWNHHGVGHQLMSALLTRAKSQSLRKMYGRILASNRDMIEFVRGCGFEISDSSEGHWLKIASINL